VRGSHCDRDLTPLEGQKFCPFCGGELETLQQPEGPAESEPEPESEPFVPPSVKLVRDRYCPWEDQETLGFFRGIGQTLRQSLWSPGEFFRTMPQTGGLLTPLLYALIINTTGMLAGFVWLLLFDSPLLAKLGMQGNTGLMLGITVPLGVLLSIVAEAAVLHGCLFVVGGATENFEATFRVVCYSAGPELLNAVPLIGAWVSKGWQVYLLILGLRTAHNISTGRSVIAVLMPSLVCLGLFGVIVIFIVQSLSL
jgi:hypothetical protein